MKFYLYIAIACCLVKTSNLKGCKERKRLPPTINPTLKKLMTYNLASGECDGLGKPFNSVSLYSHRNRILHFAKVHYKPDDSLGFCAVDFQYSDLHLIFHSRLFVCYENAQNDVFYGYPKKFLLWLDSLGKCDGNCTIGAPKEEYIRQFSEEIGMSLQQDHKTFNGYQITNHINRVIFWLKTIKERTVTFEFYTSSDGTLSIFGLGMSQTLGYIEKIFEKERTSFEWAEGYLFTPPISTVVKIPWLDAVATCNISHIGNETVLRTTVADFRIGNKEIFKSYDNYHFFKMVIELPGDRELHPQVYSVDHQALPIQEVIENEFELKNSTFNITASDAFNLRGLLTVKLVNKIYREGRFGRQSQYKLYEQYMTFFKSPGFNNNVTFFENWTEEGTQKSFALNFGSSSFNFMHFSPNDESSIAYKDPLHKKLAGSLQLLLPLEFVFSSLTVTYLYDKHNFFVIKCDFPISENKLHFSVRGKLDRRRASNEWIINMHSSNIWSVAKDLELFVLQIKRWKTEKPYKHHEITVSAKGKREHITRYLILIVNIFREVIRYANRNMIVEQLGTIFEDVFGQSFVTIANKAPSPVHTFVKMLKSLSNSTGVSLLSDLDRYEEYGQYIGRSFFKFLDSFSEDIKLNKEYYAFRFTTLQFLRELQIRVISVLTDLLPELDVENLASFFRTVKYKWMESLEDWIFA